MKDLLKGWYLLCRSYLKQIRKYQFDSLVKEKGRQLAQHFYNKYYKIQNSNYRVVWDERTSNKYFSVLIYGKEPYPYFGFPINFIEADPLKSNIFHRIFREWPSGFVDLKHFALFFWQMKRASKVKFTPAELQLLKTVFK
ncbi:MAG: hypothetical protein ACFFCZ_05100 [Promethearchaeota archaeon]